MPTDWLIGVLYVLSMNYDTLLIHHLKQKVDKGQTDWLIDASYCSLFLRQILCIVYTKHAHSLYCILPISNFIWSSISQNLDVKNLSNQLPDRPTNLQLEATALKLQNTILELHFIRICTHCIEYSDSQPSFRRNEISSAIALHEMFICHKNVGFAHRGPQRPTEAHRGIYTNF